MQSGSQPSGHAVFPDGSSDVLIDLSNEHDNDRGGTRKILIFIH